MKHAITLIISVCAVFPVALVCARDGNSFSQGPGRRFADGPSDASGGAYNQAPARAQPAPAQAPAVRAPVSPGGGGSFRSAPVEQPRTYTPVQTPPSPPAARTYTPPQVAAPAREATPTLRIPTATPSHTEPPVVRTPPAVQLPAEPARTFTPQRETVTRGAAPTTVVAPEPRKPAPREIIPVQPPAEPKRSTPVITARPVEPARPPSAERITRGEPPLHENAIRPTPVREAAGHTPVQGGPGAGGPTATIRTPLRDADRTFTRSPGVDGSRIAAPPAARKEAPSRLGLTEGTSAPQPDRLPPGVSLRTPPADPLRKGPPEPRSGPSRINTTRDLHSAVGIRPSSRGPYGDGHPTVYPPPSQPAYPVHGGSTPYNGWHPDGRWHHQPPPPVFDPWTFSHAQGAFPPPWGGPAITIVGGAALSWGTGVSSITIVPNVCAPVPGPWYGSGWRHGWYGRFSYCHNPWPVYQTYYWYDYDSEPVVTQTETVYITQPVTTTYVVQSPAETAAVSTQAGPVVTTTIVPAADATAPQPAATVTTTIVQPLTTAAAEPLEWDSAPAADHVDAIVGGCFCACHCNGQRPCVCAYPCGSEYTVTSDTFNLGQVFVSYAESLNSEAIWYSYKGLDRADAYGDPEQ